MPIDPAALQGLIDAERSKADAAAAQLVAIRASTSWRITAPLRRVMSRLRGDVGFSNIERAPGSPAANEHSLSEVTNPARYLDPSWRALHHDLEGYSIDKHCFQNTSGEIYRKGWEWTHCLFGLRELGMLQPHFHALGVGVGREPVIFYLATKIAHVTATDLYGGAEWSGAGGKEADLAVLEASKQACADKVDFTKISFENQDGTKLSYPDDSFDFAWSLSSIEHFGGHAAAVRAVQEMARVVRPGGILAIATEMLLLEEYSHPEYFTKQELVAKLVNSAPNIELVGPINFYTLGPEYLLDSIVVPAGVDRRRRHVVLNDGAVQWTSILLFFRVKPEPGYICSTITGVASYASRGAVIKC